MAHPAPFSSSITYKWTYDAFLSFHGEDTRLGFTNHLFHSLRQRGIHAFIDDELLRTGEKITPALFTAIQESRIAIIVFSENYASSTFCLRELVKILKCFKEESRLIYPVFYHVDPSELRRPRGSYAEALALLEEDRFRHKRHKVEKWRLALSQAADLKGCHLQPKIAKEQECIARITNKVAARINLTPLHVTNYPVGLLSRVKEVISCLNLWCTESKKMIGIWGAGGIGKSTIARAVYNSIADNFDCLCFLFDVRQKSQMPNGLSHLQKTLLRKLVMEKDPEFDDYHEGIPIIKHRLSQKKILLILDDVDNSNQLEALAGSCDWFGSGSRIIITTRNKQLLVSQDVESIYDAKELNDEESLKLLCWYAFKKENVDFNYVEVCNRAIDYSCGFPLALEVIGSNLHGKKVTIWSSALDDLKLEGTLDERILKALRSSYDALGKVEKQVFLDLTCFFNGEKLTNVIDILKCVRAIKPEYVLDRLIDRSLVKIEQGHVKMHDLIEDVGKEIVRQDSPNGPGGQSRLWFYRDILQVLQQDTGTKKVEAIILDLPESEEVQWSGEAFIKMKNLKMLVIKKACFSECPKYLPNSLRWLEWKGYPFQLLPNMHSTELVYLDLSCSFCELLQPFDKKFGNVICINLRNCKFLQQIPESSGASNLRELWLDGCTNLTEIHDSVGCLSNLKELSAMRCTNLKKLPSCLELRSLEHLNLFGCSSLQRFPEILVMMEKLQALDLDKTAITELPSSIHNLVGLETLNLEECPNLKQLPASIFALPNLWKLTANSSEGMSHFYICEGGDEASFDRSTLSLKLEHFCFSSCNLSYDSLVLCLSHFTNIIHLDLSFNNFTVLPKCIKEYQNLKYLLLDNCNKLRHIGGMPPNLEKFSAICCASLTKLSKSKVLKQAFKFQNGKRNFILPGKNLPRMLHNLSGRSSMSFWVHHVFPTTFLWILVKDDEDYVYNCKISVHINGTRLDISSKWHFQSAIKTNHIYICDMQSMIHSTELPLRNDKWNEVNVSIESKPRETRGQKEIYLGVHVYNLPSNIENIRFTEPTRYSIGPNLLQRVQDWEDLVEDVNPDSNLMRYAESIESPLLNLERQTYCDSPLLKVDDYKGTTLVTWLGSNPSSDNLIKLHLTSCGNCSTIPSLGQLPALKSLIIEGLKTVVSVASEFFKAPAVSSSSSLIPFPSLESLHFGCMLSWVEWNSTNHRQTFPKLRTLGLYNCPNLIGNLPSQLVSLERLEIKACPLLACSIPDCPKIQELHIIESPKVVFYEEKLQPLSLRLLTISWPLMLEPPSEELHIQDLTVRDCSFEEPFPVIHIPPSLKELVIRECENLKFVLVSKSPPYVMRGNVKLVLVSKSPPYVMRGNVKLVSVSRAPPLVHLQTISVANCKFLRSLFDDMECLVPNLKELCISECPEMEPFSAGSLPSSLKQLEIRNCGRLLSCDTKWHHLPRIIKLLISTPSQTLHCYGLQWLTSLQELQIYDSPKLEILEGGKMPPSLQSLHVRGCLLLQERCHNRDDQIWRRISHVPYITLNRTGLIKVH